MPPASDCRALEDNARRLRSGADASWADASRLFVVGDGFGWSIDDDRTRLTRPRDDSATTSRRVQWARFAKRQSVFHHDHFGALQPRWLDSSHRLGLSYFHGRPGTVGYPEFDRALRGVERTTRLVSTVCR